MPTHLNFFSNKSWPAFANESRWPIKWLQRQVYFVVWAENCRNWMAFIQISNKPSPHSPLRLFPCSTCRFRCLLCVSLCFLFHRLTLLRTVLSWHKWRQRHTEAERPLGCEQPKNNHNPVKPNTSKRESPHVCWSKVKSQSWLEVSPEICVNLKVIWLELEFSIFLFYFYI